MEEWVPELQMVLHELLRHEGLGGTTIERCPLCPPGAKTVPTYHCKDCFTNVLLCRTCCVNSHRSNPFHRIRVSLIGYCTCGVANVLLELERRML